MTQAVDGGYTQTHVFKIVTFILMFVFTEYINYGKNKCTKGEEYICLFLKVNWISEMHSESLLVCIKEEWT